LILNFTEPTVAGSCRPGGKGQNPVVPRAFEKREENPAWPSVQPNAAIERPLAWKAEAQDRALGDTDEVSEGSSDKRALGSDARRAGRVIRSLLLAWDAIGVWVPGDEYDCMIWPLYKLICQRSSTHEIAAWVGDHRRDHFGLQEDREADTKLAERLLAAFTDQ
jgi:hypothetical protein